MTRRTTMTLALATLLALALTGYVATSRAQDGQRTVSLSPGCNMLTLTFASGTSASALTTAVSPSSALQAVWRLDNASRSFQAFLPQAPQASDLTSLNLLDAVFICADAAASISLPAVSPDPAGAPVPVNLSMGCNAVGLSFSAPEGIVPTTVAAAIAPTEAFQSLWRLDNATGSFQAYVAAAPQASDLTSLAFLDAVFICAAGPATLTMPAVTAPGAVGPVGPVGPTTDVRYLMETAVPQVVDLPQGFVAIDEIFVTSGEAGMPPEMRYFYGIAYGDPLAFVLNPFETPWFIEFDLAVFDTTAHAQSFMQAMVEETEGKREVEVPESAGLEVDSITVEEVEPLTTIGQEASFIRVRLYARPPGSSEMFLPIVMDVFTLRRDSIVGQVFLMWTWGPPGPKFIPENLAKKMDAGIQQVLPQLLAAVP